MKAESHGAETLSANERPVLTPVAAELTASIRPSLLLLSGAVFFVLLVVCANLATLMLVRTADRRNEFAVRAALGAQRGSLMRQQFVESGLLALAGAGAGVFVAYGALAALYRFRPVALAQFPPPAIEAGVLIFTMALAVATGLLFGIGPAWMAGHQDPGEVLKARGRSITPSHNRLRRVLVSGEIAVAFVLLVSAMLLARTIHKLNQVPLGFEIQNRLTFSVALHGEMYKKEGSTGLFYDNALERLAHLPGVTGAAAISNLPLDRRPDMYLSVRREKSQLLSSRGAARGQPGLFWHDGHAADSRPGFFHPEDRRGTDRVVGCNSRLGIQTLAWRRSSRPEDAVHIILRSVCDGNRGCCSDSRLWAASKRVSGILCALRPSGLALGDLRDSYEDRSCEAY